MFAASALGLPCLAVVDPRVPWGFGARATATRCWQKCHIITILKYRDQGTRSLCLYLEC